MHRGKLVRAVVAMAVAVPAMAACRDDDGSSEGDETARSTKTGESGTCAPVPLSGDAPKPTRRVRTGIPFTARVAPGVRLEVVDAVAADRFADRASDQPGAAYQPAPDARFVVVVFEFANRSGRPAEAANTVGRLALLVDDQGRAWRRADEVEACGAASASAAALAKGAVSPETDAPAGERYTTVIAYTVPADSTSVEWTIDGTRVPVRPRPR
jgi:hypothetical protein